MAHCCVACVGLGMGSLLVQQCLLFMVSDHLVLQTFFLGCYICWQPAYQVVALDRKSYNMVRVQHFTIPRS